MAPRKVRQIAIAAGAAAVLAVSLGVYAASSRIGYWLTWLEPFDPVDQTTTELGVQHRFHNFSVTLPAKWVAPRTQFNRPSSQMAGFQTPRGSACQVFFGVDFFHARARARPIPLEPVAQFTWATGVAYGSRRIGGLPARTVEYRGQSRRGGAWAYYEWVVDKGEYFVQGDACWRPGRKACREEVLRALDSLKIYPP